MISLMMKFLVVLLYIHMHTTFFLGGGVSVINLQVELMEYLAKGNGEKEL